MAEAYWKQTGQYVSRDTIKRRYLEAKIKLQEETMFAYVVTVAQIRQHAEVWDISLDRFEGMPDDEEFVFYSEKELEEQSNTCGPEIQAVTENGEIVKVRRFGVHNPETQEGYDESLYL